MLFFVISWLLCGILSSFIIVVCELRGEKYDTSYFEDIFPNVLIVCLGGYVSALVAIPVSIVIRCEKHKTSVKNDIYKFVYKIANIGLNKNNNMNSIRNAERLSNLLSGDAYSIDCVSDEIWNITKLNDEFEDYRQLREWLKEKSSKTECVNKI